MGGQYISSPLGLHRSPWLMITRRGSWDALYHWSRRERAFNYWWYRALGPPQEFMWPEPRKITSAGLFERASTRAAAGIPWTIGQLPTIPKTTSRAGTSPGPMICSRTKPEPYTPWGDSSSKGPRERRS